MVHTRLRFRLCSIALTCPISDQALVLESRGSGKPQRGIVTSVQVVLQAQHGKRHGRAVGPGTLPRGVRRRRRVGVAHHQPLVEEGHDHLLGVGRELLEQRCRVRVGRLEEDLGGGAHAVGRLRCQGLRLEALRNVEEDLVWLLADDGMLPEGSTLVSMLEMGKMLRRRDSSRLGKRPGSCGNRIPLTTRIWWAKGQNIYLLVN